MLTKLSKLVKFLKKYDTEAVLAGTVILISFLSFQAGKIHTLGKLPGRLDFQETANAEIFLLKDSPPPSPVQKKIFPATGLKLPVVVSRNSNKYHFLWCPGAGKISAKNKITFHSAEEALAAGYVLAANCRK